MAKKSLKVIDAKYVEDHIAILENLEFAVYALEN